MHLSSLLCGALAFLLISTPVAAVAPCTNAAARPRKEFRNLSSAERNNYFAALRALKAENTTGGRPSTYDRLSNIHISNAAWVHGYANFFAWHRRYLREVERHLHRISGNNAIMIPYWQWTLDSQAPETSPIFSSNAFGGRTACMSSGPMANWRPYYPSNHCLSRRFDGGSVISSWDSVPVMNSIIASSNTHNNLRLQIEGGGHASVHVNIGGDFSTMHSTNDPLFWSHHAFIDKIWDDWQKRNGWSNYWRYEGPNHSRSRAGSRAAITDVMYPWSTTVRQILWTENLNYCYQPYSASGSPQLTRRQSGVPPFVKVTPLGGMRGAAAEEEELGSLPTSSRITTNTATTTPANVQTTGLSPTDRTNLFKLRYSKPIPEDYLKRNNLDVATVRNYEKIKRGWCDKLNAMDDYISSCALVNQPHALQYLATTAPATKLYGVARGEYMEVDVTAVKQDPSLAYQVYQQVAQTMKSKYGNYLSRKDDSNVVVA